MITEITRAKIKGFLESFIQSMIDNFVTEDFDFKAFRPTRDASQKGKLKPFHEVLLPNGIMTISEFERSFSTKLGTSFEECAKLVALDNHKLAERGYTISSSITTEVAAFIDSAVSRIGRHGMQVNYLELVEQTVELAGRSGETEPRSSTADLRILTNDGRELMFEIKSPKPNKGQCLEATRRILETYALRHSKYPNVELYFATAYNPYSAEKSQYKHSLALSYLDMENQVLIGKEFWELVGGEGTYEEVLDIYREVGREKGPDMTDQFVLGY